MQPTTVAQAVTQIPKVPSGSDADVACGYEDGITIGGVYCGKEIGDDLLAETLTERRYVIRQRIDPTYARRLGEVCGGQQYGGGKSFQATTPNGDHVAIRRSLKSAAKSLIKA